MQLFTGSEYLKIDIANNFGLDKKDWSDRIKWFDENEDELLNLISKAEEPALFYAGIQAWHDFKAGRPSGYPISLDATSSGLQLLAALTGDRKAASLCNVISTGHREDAYTNVYEVMVHAIADVSKIVRSDTKQAIMTSLYGSTALPKQIFGEGKLLDVFYHSMKTLAPAAWELNQAFLMMWRPDVDVNSWVLPDNFHVHIKVIDSVKGKVHFLNQPFDVFYKVQRPVEEGRSLGANTIHSVDGMIVREITRRCMYNVENVQLLKDWIQSKSHWGTERTTKDDDLVIALWDHYKNSGYLSARIPDHLNPDNGGHVDMAVISELLDSLPEKPFEVIAVHDCFRCLPKYGNDLRIQYNNQLMLIAKSKLLDYLISQIIQRPISLGKMDVNLWKDIMDSDYALS